MQLLKTGTTHCHFKKIFGDKECLKKIKECGFDGADFALNAYQSDDDFFHPDDGYILLKPEKEIKEYFGELKKLADGIGLEIGQVHAPYYFIEPDKMLDKEFLKRFINSVKATRYLGSDYLVVHPIVLSDPENNYKKNLNMNAEFYGALRPAMKEYGVTVAVENMDAINPLKKTGVPSTCSSAEKINDLLDLLGEEYCACLDTGHAFVAGQEPAHMARLLGKRLKLLHLHDNDGNDDLHVPPRCGYIDWKGFLQALKDINYNGYINMEIDYLRLTHDKETICAFGKAFAEMAREFARTVNGK